MAERNDRHPIIIVIPQPLDRRTIKISSDPPQPLVPVTGELRSRLRGELDTVDVYFRRHFESARSDLPGVAKVRLRRKALAKSRRPLGLLYRHLPVIGANGIGDLLVRVDRTGLRALDSEIAHSHSRSAEVQISAIESISPYTSDDIFRDKRALDRGPAKVRLFSYRNQDLDQRAIRLFEQTAHNLGSNAAVNRVDYGSNALVYRVEGLASAELQQLAEFPAVNRICAFSVFHTVRTQASPIGRLTAKDLPSPDPAIDYPIVGVIDSGTDTGNELLQRWVHKRWERVPAQYQDNTHGSFVAGLLINCRGLNHGRVEFPSGSCRILDVVVLPADGEVREDDLLQYLEEALREFPDTRVWNLSLGTNGDCCDQNAFSDFSMKLDELQDNYNVRFVIASGNVRDLRPWPTNGYAGVDRICPPADSVRGITVGSVAHLESPKSLSTRGDPSPFSRRGPGPGFVPKPEVSHLGGNCTSAGDYSQIGVISVNGSGQKAEDIGTSFSTPLVSSILSHIYDRAPSVSHPLAKALLIHSAVSQHPSLEASHIPYKGFGVPADPDDAIFCSGTAATLVFEPELELSRVYEFVKTDFPIPDCLRTDKGGFCGEIIMTLVYDPPLDPAFGAEYCRTNVEASLGTYEWNPERQTVENFKGMIPLDPSPKRLKEMYEEHLVEHGFKWSPVKVYRKRFHRAAPEKKWLLRLSAQKRGEHMQLDEGSEKQKVAVVLTIKDPEGKQPVYEQVTSLIAAQNWIVQRLEVQTRVRTRVR